jgi:hypothetical protein
MHPEGKMPKNKRNRQPGPPKAQSALETLDIVHPNAAAADIGSREIWVSLPPDRAGETVRCFGTFTPDLESLVQWLLDNRVDTVAMESTGVYWIPLFELLETHQIKAYLVNAQHIHNVPGRKTDVLDCQSPKGRRSALVTKIAPLGLAQPLLPPRRRNGSLAHLPTPPG